MDLHENEEADPIHPVQLFEQLNEAIRVFLTVRKQARSYFPNPVSWSQNKDQKLSNSVSLCLL